LRTCQGFRALQLARDQQNVAKALTSNRKTAFIFSMNQKLPLILSLAALLALSACNPHGASSQSDFNAAGQALGSGNIGAGATDTGHAFSQGAQATGQAIGSAAQQSGTAINHTFNGNNGN
jgi:hypothetical protein